MKISASIDLAMPDGTALAIAMASGSGSSNGLCDVSRAVSPVTLVTGITRGIDRNQAISYVLTAEDKAGEIVGESRTLTLTLTN